MLLRTDPSPPSPRVLPDLTAKGARDVIGVVSVALGVTQLLAPQWLSRVFGVPPKKATAALDRQPTPELFYYQRLFAVRNLQLGLAVLDPDPERAARGLTDSATVVALDVPVTLWAAARGHLSRRGAVALLGVLGGYAFLNVRARADGPD